MSFQSGLIAHLKTWVRGVLAEATAYADRTADNNSIDRKSIESLPVIYISVESPTIQLDCLNSPTFEVVTIPWCINNIP
jgi:hypothetical protein